MIKVSKIQQDKNNAYLKLRGKNMKKQEYSKQLSRKNQIQRPSAKQILKYLNFGNNVISITKLEFFVKT